MLSSLILATVLVSTPANQNYDPFLYQVEAMAAILQNEDPKVQRKYFCPTDIVGIEYLGNWTISSSLLKVVGNNPDKIDSALEVLHSYGAALNCPGWSEADRNQAKKEGRKLLAMIGKINGIANHNSADKKKVKATYRLSFGHRKPMAIGILQDMEGRRYLTGGN